MSDASATAGLGDVEPTRSRHAGRRSTVVAGDETLVVGTADGAVRAFDVDPLAERWSATPEATTADAPTATTERNDAASPSVVSATITDGTVVVGERSLDGAVRSYDLRTGARRFRYETVDDIGSATKRTRFFLPFVVDIVSDDERVYVAARRYERDGDGRSFTSAVYAFDPDGGLLWEYRTDGSPISLDVEGERVAVAYNRCPGNHQHGLVVLDRSTGASRVHWDPGTTGQRRVGDVSLCSDGLAVASHGDYRGYRLDSDGADGWCVDLARPTEIGDETLYAYPNHVHATDDGVLFVTGNSYAEDSRETANLHPNEHTVFGYSPEGRRRWTDSIGGFATGIDTDGNRVGIPAAQHFRSRDPDAHGYTVFEVSTGRCRTTETAGVVTAIALDGQRVAAIEEPVRYHDGNRTHGRYRLHVDETATFESPRIE